MGAAGVGAAWLLLHGVAQLAARAPAGRQGARRGTGDGPAIVGPWAEPDRDAAAGGQVELVVGVRLGLFPVDPGAEAGVVLLARGRGVGRRGAGRRDARGGGLRRGRNGRGGGDHGGAQQEDGEHGRGGAATGEPQDILA